MILCLGLVGMSEVKASEITFKGIGEYLVSKQEEANNANKCFNSKVNVSNNEISISYTLKSSDKECVEVPEWSTKFVYKDGKYLLFESSVTEELVRSYASKNYGLKSVIDMDKYWVNVLLRYLDLPSGLDGSSFRKKYEMVQGDYSYSYESSDSIAGGGMNFYERFAYCLSNLIEVSTASNSVTLKIVGFMKDPVLGDIERSSDNTNYKSLGKTIKVGDSFTDTGLTPSTKYYYKFQGEVVEATTLSKDANDGGGKEPSSSGGNKEEIKNPNTGDETLFLAIFLVLGLAFIGYKFRRM